MECYDDAGAESRKGPEEVLHRRGLPRPLAKGGASLSRTP